ELGGCGGVLRNDKDSIIASFSYPLQVICSNLAELLAIKTALEVFTKTDWFDKVNLIIKSDSANAVQWVNDPSSKPWVYWDVREFIDRLIMEIGEVRFTFAYREINCLADAMAKAGIDRHCLFFACW
ncbi:hypothetical protein Gohar_020095, partial [Gossypium harknessii]|nr:hypothetical protein [Gossypium raimondii]MBA0697416.1 hypothetical protein [Gossypium aridum]MBA0814255.1 hypothetical protein [Gossypium harknessii]